MEREKSPEINKSTEIDFIYSKESEVDRVRYTVLRKDFYQKNYGNKTFNLPLPEGSTLEGLTDDFEEIVEKELDLDGVEKVKKDLEKEFNENYEVIRKFFIQNFGSMPEKIKVRMTKYGTGGSYELPAGMTINFKSFKNYLGNLIHELVHCQIEESIVKKYGLTQQEKESIVEWLTMNDPEISALDPYRRHYFGPPSEELLKRVGLTRI